MEDMRIHVTFSRILKERDLFGELMNERVILKLTLELIP
jgi:hypothetical protein